MEEASFFAPKRQRTSEAEGVTLDTLEVHILTLVAEREKMRLLRKFPESDAIRDQLRQMGVELYDKEKQWKSKCGRSGVLFTAGPQECFLTDEQIVEKVNAREQARLSKDHGSADDLRDEMRNLGIELDDKTRTWRTLFGRSGSYNGRIMSSFDAGQSTPSHTGTGQFLSDDAIKILVAQRERLRSSQDFDGADECRRQLAHQGVELFDNERIWRASDGRQGVIISGGYEVHCTMSEQEILVRVQQREHARFVKDWGQADTIREELRSRGVELLDGQKIWRTTDGRNGPYTHNMAHQALPTNPGAPKSADAALASIALTLASRLQQHRGPVMAPWGPPENPPERQSAPLQAPCATGGAPAWTVSTTSIEALVAGRERLRAARDFQGADAIRIDLRQHGVEVWDKEKRWKASDGRSGPL